MTCLPVFCAIMKASDDVSGLTLRNPTSWCIGAPFSRCHVLELKECMEKDTE